ncbi:MAG: hypothetical protein ACR2FG_13875 [Marmoricola sp.]
MTSTERPTSVQVMAAQVAMMADKRLGRESPADIQKLAATPPEEIRDRRSPDGANSERPTSVQVLAAQVAMMADKRLGRESPADIQKLAATPPEEIRGYRPHDGTNSERPTSVQVMAAQVAMMADKRLGRESPLDIQRLAATPPDQIRDRRSPDGANSECPTSVQVMAAQVSMMADKRLGRESPADIQKLAATPPEDIRDRRSPVH